MNTRRWKMLCWLAGLLLFGGFVIWPMIDRQLMEIPMTDGIAALRTGNITKLALSFTPEARVFSGLTSVEVSRLLLRFSPRLAEAPPGGSLRFGGYSSLTRHGAIVHADATFIYDYQNDDLPYRSLPVRLTEGVTLQKTGYFTWQITEIRLKDDALKALLSP